MTNTYYLEHRQDYVDGFANYMKREADTEFAYDEVKEIFIGYMYNHKNIEVEFNPFWQAIMNDAMKQAGYHFCGFGGEL